MNSARNLLEIAHEFCREAFAPFGVNTEPYAEILAQLLDYASSDGAGESGPGGVTARPGPMDGTQSAIAGVTPSPSDVPIQRSVETVTWEDVAEQLFAVDGNGFWVDATPLQAHAYEIRAKAVVELYAASAQSAPVLAAAQNSAEGDPAVKPDYAGADALPTPGQG